MDTIQSLLERLSHKEFIAPRLTFPPIRAM
jgi:hypothetical protein